MAQFIAHGYVTVTPNLPAEFHADVFAHHEEVFAKEGNPGNNLLPRIPLIREVFTDPVVRGALRSVVGDDYYLQPHRHPHFNPAHSKGQNMHQDGGKRWSHRTRYLLAFYYPQDTPLERGPSAIVPGSHYFNTPEGARTAEELPLICPAGPVTIVNYDLWHRQMPNQTEHNRYMVKFLFARMSEPVAPSWHNDQNDWPGAPRALDGDSEELQKMHAHVWNWHRGAAIGPTERASNGHSPAQLAHTLKSDRERAAMRAAYELAALGEEAVPHVLEMLADESEMTRRHAAYALSAIGEPAVAALKEMLSHADPVARAGAAETLGDIGRVADSALPALIAAMNDPGDEVRRCAADALGTVCGTATADSESAPTAVESAPTAVKSAPTAVAALIVALTDEEVNVRRMATFSLARLSASAGEAVAALESVLDDENRYVRGDALHALERIGTPAAKDALIRHLVPARWCPLTSPESTF